jgi:hypothetical protein
MNEIEVRALLFAQDERILQTHRAAAELRQSVICTQLAILESQELINRSDRLIHAIARVFGTTATPS